MYESNASDLMSAILTFQPLGTSNVTQDRIIKKYELESYIVPMVLDNIHVGIEIEVENCVGTKEPAPELSEQFNTFWSETDDNSLRNNGLEFISKPVSGKRIPVALRVIKKYLDLCFTNHKFTSRTSVHVHVNCRHMTQEAFFNFVLLYIVAEPIFYKYADMDGAACSQNNFCVPLEDTKFVLGLPSIIAAYNRGDVKGAVKLLIGAWKKYTGFNLLPMRTQGTAEFRHLGGTSDPEFLLFWINLILSLRKYAQETTIKETKATVFALNTISSYTVFISNLLGIKDIPYDELQTALEVSSTTVKSVFSQLELNKQLLKVDESFPESRLFKQLDKRKAVINFEVIAQLKDALNKQLILVSKKINLSKDNQEAEKYYKKLNIITNKIQALDYENQSAYFSFARSTRFGEF